MRLAPSLLAFAIVLPGAAAAAADDEVAPGARLIAALSRVPDTLASRASLISYVDYREVEAARSGAARPASFAELDALIDAGDPSVSAWLSAAAGVSSGSGDLLRALFVHGAEWPALLGFDFFDVDQELAFGSPPSDGVILLGDFDHGAIGSALAARGYATTSVGERTLWCGAVGCEGGLTMDVANREPAVPFGGELGRSEPLAVSAIDLLSSADLATIEGMMAASVGEMPSLSDDPSLQALVGSLDPEALVLQATIVPRDGVVVDPAALAASVGSSDAPQVAVAELAAAFEPIPPWSMAAIVDGATETEQLATIVLAYESGEDAAIAADVVPRRFHTLGSLAVGQPFAEMLAGLGVTSVTGRTVTSSNGGPATAVIELRAPLAGTGPDPDADRPAPSSAIYRVLLNQVFRRDALWLVPHLPLG